jgi:starch phosphorylase
MEPLTKENIQQQADTLVGKIKQYLISLFGRVLEEATSDEFYRAFCYAIRERIMINWQATADTWHNANAKMIFYLSIEFLPGRFLNNNLCSLKEQPVFNLALQKTGRTLEDLIRHENDPGLGNGGLGRLAACFIDSLATLKIPSRGYGLRYQYGLFEQQVWDGHQIEKPDSWLWYENPWEFRRDMRKTIIKFSGTPIKKTSLSNEEIYDITNYDEVWAMPFDYPILGYSPREDFDVSTLRLWSTKESPRNFDLQRYYEGRLDQASENTTLTDVLYPNDIHSIGKRTRLKQEFLLVSASIQDIFRYFFSKNSDIQTFKDKVRLQINDTHPALLIAELMRQLTKHFGMTWKDAWETTQQCISYTNHTILSEALEVWDQNLLQLLLPRQYRIIERINLEFCSSVRDRFPNNEEKVRRMSILENFQVRMANLAIVGSHKVNGVAALHSEILKKDLFKDFYELWPNKFCNVTNGITPRRWLMYANPTLADFITAKIGDKWKEDFSHIQKLADFASDNDTQEGFLEVKRQAKIRFLNYLRQEARPRDATGRFAPAVISADPSFLFDTQAKRIHEYKRQLINALHLIMLYYEILDNPYHERQKRFAIFSGKAAASYEIAKTIIRLIHCIAQKVNYDPIVSQYLNVSFVENYNVSKAEIIIPATDLSEQLSTAGMEASGTGNMKFSINGALTIGTEDGANIEMRQAIGDAWWPFRFGATSDEIEKMKHEGSYRAWDVYRSNQSIKRAVDSLRDRSLVTTDQDHQSLSALYYTLLEGTGGQIADRFFVLYDLKNYYDTQKNVEELFRTPHRWAEYALHNIAGMGIFSSDRAINQYNSEIWNVPKMPIQQEELTKINDEYKKISQGFCSTQ